MEKRTYIQPEMEVAVLPKDALMGDIMQGLPGTGGGPTVGGGSGTGGTNPAPKRLTEIF